ncbi:MAG TPA: Mur ligase family protein [Candidatus Saccharimonadales bacterium]|nr:Mur ligase family protein [Candidatus Saccharimonadales bacterium]
MDPQLTISVFAGKATKQFLKLRSSGGTAAPGLFSLYLDKNALKKLSAGLERTILVTGTNGKTTTTRLIGNFLEKENISFVHNRAGSNLERGIVSSLLEQTNFSGQVGKTTGLFEIDEAALATTLTKLKPTILVITNLFRDQLDRYGEVDNIKRLWEKALVELPQSTTLVLNADDPTVAYLGKSKAKVIYFGIADETVKLDEKPTTLDTIVCPVCQGDLEYSAYFSSHQGDYRCSKCDFKRPELDFFAQEINFSEGKTQFVIKNKEETTTIETPLLGLFNVYNALASYSALKGLELPLTNFADVAADFKSVFGRGENLTFNGHQLLVALAKNPTGFNEIIRTYLEKPKQTTLIVINDKIADGRDVSWLWDVDFEKLLEKDDFIFTSGLRGADMALRLKYAGFKNFENIESLEAALEKATNSLGEGETLTVIPTYTAMLELKQLLAKKGLAGQFWED